ncbi:hypothetical protein EVAR_31546_1 [Eumeta japonica]|uniref:Uncharacterized protein n=1 Tax=Eumeta variegata TaxID=151549 RepID=A0A4C1V8Q3_EUMVA|nr:hypothetical protein EVAR_31546_1 [Eumeta japonica]
MLLSTRGARITRPWAVRCRVTGRSSSAVTRVNSRWENEGYCCETEEIEKFKDQPLGLWNTLKKAQLQGSAKLIHTNPFNSFRVAAYSSNGTEKETHHGEAAASGLITKHLDVLSNQSLRRNLGDSAARDERARSRDASLISGGVTLKISRKGH